MLANPNISLYCLDDASKRAIFVELPPDTDLAKAPFVYRTQYEQAQRLIALPYESFIQLAHDLPRVENLIMCYMTGRCGSTLLSHVLNELDTVLSLSEPDVATQFVHLRSAYGGRETELRLIDDRLARVIAYGEMMGPLLAITGPRGVGKTSLLRDVQDRATEAGFVVAWSAGVKHQPFLPDVVDRVISAPVSYTHLTLPTSDLV